MLNYENWSASNTKKEKNKLFMKTLNIVYISKYNAYIGLHDFHHSNSELFCWVLLVYKVVKDGGI